MLTVISVLTVAFVITVIVLCCRYYPRRSRQKSKHRHKPQRILSPQNNQPSVLPISVTPTSASSYSGRSSAQLLSDQRQQNLSSNTVPSRRLQQSMLDAYLNDLQSFQPANIDVQRLNSYLFIDLHSTSSETFPDNVSKPSTNNTRTSGYNTATVDESQRKYRSHLRNQKRRRSVSTLKQSHYPRFLMRERSLPNNLGTLPQLRQATTTTTQLQRHFDDTNDSNTTVVNQDLQSTTITTTTDEYDDSHAYNVKQNQILQTINEDKPYMDEEHFPPHLAFTYEQEPYCFEIVSTSRDDSSDMQLPYISSPIIGNRMTYINDSIIV